jgi:hypothetical protein
MSAMLLRDWASVTGIELVSERFHRSRQLLWHWQSEIQPQLRLDQQRRNTKVQFACGDATDLGVLDWTGADVVFIHTACFDAMLIARLSSLAEGLRPGALILTVSKPLVSPQIEDLFSWGCVMSYTDTKVPVFIQRRCIVDTPSHQVRIIRQTKE